MAGLRAGIRIDFTEEDFMNHRFVDTAYTPREDDILVAYRIVPRPGVPLQQAANEVASETSVGSWTQLGTMSDEIHDRCRAVAYEITETHVRIAYPQHLFEWYNLPQVLSLLAGSVFDLPCLESLQLLDIHFTPELLEMQLGPAVGRDGFRKRTGVFERPLIAGTVMPRCGLSPDAHAMVVQNTLSGGCDLALDDETLTNPEDLPFAKRVELGMRKQEYIEREAKQFRAYIPNVSAETNEMVEQARYVRDKNGRAVLINLFATGFAALQTLRDANLGVALWAQRPMGSIICRDGFGLSRLVVAKLSRLVGVDFFPIGAWPLLDEESKREALEVHRALNERTYLPSQPWYFRQAWDNIKPVFSVISGRLHPGHVTEIIQQFNDEAVIQFGGGLHGHPMGTKAGAKAIRDIMKLIRAGRDIRSAAATSEHIARVIEKWMDPAV